MDGEIGFLKDIVDDMKAGVYDFTDNGKCTSCGSCCSNLLPLSSKDIKRIKAYVEKNHIQEQKRIYPWNKEVYDITCPFRSEKDRKCMIYEARPMICRDFKCDKPKKQIEMSKLLYHDKYDICDMRGTFYET